MDVKEPVVESAAAKPADLILQQQLLEAIREQTKAIEHLASLVEDLPRELHRAVMRTPVNS